ncbi:MAG: hypothetical protein WC680_10200 [Sulfuricurvum sp.]|jgi:hypothetical protein
MNQYQALAATLGCEIPIMLLLLRTYPALRILIVSAAASLITHPFAWYVAMLLSPSEYQIGLVFIEGMVIILEGFLYWKFVPLSFKRAIVDSAIANIGSFLIGGLILS